MAKRKYSGSVAMAAKKARTSNPYKPPRGPYRELKYVDVNTASSNVPFMTANPAAVLLNGIASGSDINQRDGRKVELHSIQLKGRFFHAGVQQVIRVMVVYDKHTRGLISNAADIIADTNNPHSMLNIQNKDRYIVLFDWQVGLDPYNSVSTFDKVYFFKGKQEHFRGTGGTVGDIESGGVLLLLGAENSSGVTNPTYELFTRIKYKEI